MKLAIVTSLKWKTLPARAAALAKALSAQLPVPVEIDIVRKDVRDVPLMADGYVDHAYLKSLTTTGGHDGACLLFSQSQSKGKAKLGLRGYYLRDGDRFLDFWVVSGETSVQRNSPFGKYRFEHVFAHEFLHGLYEWIGFTNTGARDAVYPRNDATHYFDEEKGDILGAFAHVRANWPAAKEEPKRTIAQRAVALVSDPLAGLDPALARITRMTVGAMAELGKPVRVVEGYRSNERQAALYAQGRTTPGRIVTNAKPGQSKHNVGKAVDFVFRETGYDAPQKDWDLLWMMCNSFGLATGVALEWGGNWRGFPDRPHVEMV